MKNFLIYTVIVFLFNSINSFSQINTERYRIDSDSLGLTGLAGVELTAVTGNTDFQFIHLGGRLNYNWGRSYAFIVTDGGFGWDRGERIFNQALIHLRYVKSISDLMQAEAFTQADFNKKRLLLNRNLIGAGIRLKVINQDEFKARLGFSYYYEYEFYDLPEGASHGNKLYTNRMSSYITAEYEIKDQIRFLSVTYFQPDIESFSDYRIMSDNSLVVGLSSVVDLLVSFNLRYDSLPPETIKATDTITKFGFSFKF